MYLFYLRSDYTASWVKLVKYIKMKFLKTLYGESMVVIDIGRDELKSDAFCSLD